MDYERRMTVFLVWIHKQGDVLADRPSLEYFVVSSQVDVLWFLDVHEYLVHDGDSEMRMRTRCQLIKTLVEVHNIEVLSLPPLDRPTMYVPVPIWLLGWEPSSLLFVPSRSAFADYSCLKLFEFEAYEPHVWWIAIT